MAHLPSRTFPAPSVPHSPRTFPAASPHLPRTFSLWADIVAKALPDCLTSEHGLTYWASSSHAQCAQPLWLVRVSIGLNCCSVRMACADAAAHSSYRSPPQRTAPLGFSWIQTSPQRPHRSALDGTRSIPTRARPAKSLPSAAPASQLRYTTLRRAVGYEIRRYDAVTIAKVPYDLWQAGLSKLTKYTLGYNLAAGAVTGRLDLRPFAARACCSAGTVRVRS